MSTAAEPGRRRLAGKVALVTGAARGIGLAIARAFLAEGATVWLTDIDEARLAAAEAGAPTARRLALDVREETGWSAAVAAVLGRDGRLDVLVNNAGITGLEAAARMREHHPGVRVIILSMHSGEEYVLQALRAGAMGYLLKDAATGELELALRTVIRGESRRRICVIGNGVYPYGNGESGVGILRLERADDVSGVPAPARPLGGHTSRQVLALPDDAGGHVTHQPRHARQHKVGQQPHARLSPSRPVAPVSAL